MRSIKYLTTSAKKQLLRKGLVCPSCGGPGKVIDRKWIVTTLRRCQACRLLFRTPTTTNEENRRIYQSMYQEGFTTEMPTIEEWNLLVESKFDGHEKNYSNYIAVLQALGANPGAKLFDFGCSWGYGSYQLSQAGFEVDAYEISEDRAAFAARQLNISLCNPAEAIPGSYDYFFSAHVIEHVPSVSKMFQTGMRLLKPGGLFVAFAPNGSLDFRRAAAEAWHQRWGFVHPQMIDEEFLTNLPEANSLIAMSSPWSLDAIRSWEAGKRVIDSMEGDELFFAVRKN